MTSEAMPPTTGRAATPASPSTGGDAPAGEAIPVGARLQILATEHWSLLATRSLTWNESFSRSGMFLASLSASVVALALVAQASAFGEGFVVFSLVVLPFVLFVGLATHARLVAANNEDVFWVHGMNRLRHAYLDIAPDLAPYFITSVHDDARGILQSMGARAGAGNPLPAVLHGFVTTPGMIAVINAMVGGVIGGLAGVQLGVAMNGAVLTGALAFVGLLVGQFAYAARSGRQMERRARPRFPSPPEPAPGP